MQVSRVHNNLVSWSFAQETNAQVAEARREQLVCRCNKSSEELFIALSHHADWRPSTTETAVVLADMSEPPVYLHTFESATFNFILIHLLSSLLADF